MKLVSLLRRRRQLLSFSTNSSNKTLTDSLSSNPFLPLFSCCTAPSSLKKLHSQLLVNGLTHHLIFQTKLLSLYASLGDIKHARMLFDRMSPPELFAYNVLIRCYNTHEWYAEAITLYKQLRWQLAVGDNVVLSMVLKACCKLLDFDEGKRIQCDIVKFGDPDAFVINVLIDMYTKCEEMDSARRLFDACQERNVVSWTSIISGYVQNDCSGEGFMLFNSMRQEGVMPSEYTMGVLLTGCSTLAALHQGKWIHGSIMKTGISVNPYIGSALIDMYMKCGDVFDAHLVFNELCDVDLVSWTAIIVGYTQQGHPVEALKVFTDKKWACVVPNSVTLASVLAASAQLRDLSLGRSIHASVLKLGLQDHDVIRNALVDMYAKCHEMFDANYIFTTTLQKNAVTWNVMIAGYSQNGCGYEALCLFHQMRIVGCIPDAITVVSALSACACLGALHFGCPVHVHAMKCGFLWNIYVSTALLNFYNKCGDAKSARLVFDEMSEKNTVTWCAMMGGYGVQGDSIALFSDMLKENLQPNHVTFTNILSACSHTGMVSEGRQYFDSMSQLYGIVPSMKHYACMVDMLARAGQLKEAFEFISRMPMQAEVSVWGAFLHGCRLHSRLDLGEMAVKRMIELHPETADYYILIYNFYATDSRWTEADKIRKLLEERRLSKSPGRSYVTMYDGYHSSALTGTFGPRDHQREVVCSFG